jgi:hypothetical protein
MTTTENFYVAMGKAVKDRDHAKDRIAFWQGRVNQAEAEIESLIVTQHVDEADKPVEVSDGV